MEVALYGPGVYEPNTVLRNSHLEKLVDTSDEWIVRMTGIRERRISFDKNAAEMGIEAAKDLERKINRRLQEEYVLFASNNHPEGEFPQYGGAVTHALDMNGGFSEIGAGCTGVITGIEHAYGLVKSKTKKSVLVVGSEQLSAMTNFDDRTTCILFGDGAGAYRVGPQNGTGSTIIATYTTGEYDAEGDLSHPKGNGKRLSVDATGNFSTYDWEGHYLEMRGRRVFRFAVPAMEEAIQEVAKKAGYETLDQIDAIIPHGANMRIIGAAMDNLKYKGRVCTTLEWHGNTSVASIPLAHDHALREGIVNEGDRVILVAFGAGMTYGATLIRQGKNPYEQN